MIYLASRLGTLVVLYLSSLLLPRFLDSFDGEADRSLLVLYCEDACTFFTNIDLAN